jgi:hypothetical protein
MRIVSPLIKYFFDTDKARGVGCVEGERSKTIVLPITTIQPFTPIYFQPDNDLTKSVIKSVECVSGENLTPVFQGGNAYDNPVAAQLAGAILVLSNLKREIIAELPLYTLIRSVNQGKASFTQFKDIDWQACYVFITSVGGLASSNAICLRVYYSDKI